MKAIIVGAGIAGLATAKALQLLDWDVEIFEQAPALKPAGAGIVLSANALKALKALGLYDSVVEVGYPLERSFILNSRGSVLSTIDHSQSGKISDLPGSISLHRADLQQALLSEIPRIRLHKGKKCVGVDQTADEVTLRFEGGEKVKGDLLIACDGIHSIVRGLIFPGTELRYSGYTCWRGISNFPIDKSHLAISTESWGRGKRFGMVPLKNQRVYWFACLNSSEGKNPDMAKLTLEDLVSRFSGFHKPVVDLLKSTSSSHILWNDIIDLKPIPSFSKGRVVLVGDAAHATTPNMGQGACQALEDVAVLGSLFMKNDYQTAFRKFDQLRVPRTQKIVNQSWQIGKIAQWEHPIGTRLRNLLLKSMPASANRKQLDSLMNIEFDKVCNC